jgi:3-dehydroquinate dehydratase / shikimate dehydrogenase
MATAKLCVTVTGRTTAELRERRDRVTDRADLVELRVDSVNDPDAAGALADRRKPVIFTCRPTWEGGAFAGSEEERKRILRDAQQRGAEYVDIEWRAGFRDLIAERSGRGVVLSMHDFAGVPRDLNAVAAEMRATGAEVTKLAVTTGRLSESLPLKAIACASAAPSVVIAMGETGLATRLLASRFGSCWTYAGDGVAPGQIPASAMLDQYGFRHLGERTAVYGVVGRPVTHSISPAMHNAAFQDLKVDAVYLPLAAADFEDFLAFATALPIEGVSVTAPFKIAAFEEARAIDPASRRVGAVNTLRRQAGGWEACNTDVAGFLAPLGAQAQLQGRRATILGAGGAARAVVEGLSHAGSTVTIAARRSAQAQQLARSTGATAGSWPPAANSWDLLVNTTPVGTSPNVDASPLPDGPFTGELVYDLVYNPLDTRLLRDARAAGCRTIGGLDMLIAQAERQFEWWTGAQPREGVMREAALRALRSTV